MKAQEYLNQYYPHTQRSKITELFINEKSLEENLDLTDFTHLTKLDLSNNYLTGITFLSNSKLTYLDITNNDFPLQDLSIFSQLTSLESLFIRNEVKHWTSSKKETLITKYKFQSNIYNKFCGSLKPLKNLSKLENLDVSNTKIDRGLEYLPESLKRFRCENIPYKKVKEWIIKNIYRKEEMLKEEGARAAAGLFSCLTTWVSFDTSDCSYELKAWRENNLPLIRENKENDKLLSICDIIRRKKIVHEREQKVLNIITFYLEEKTIKIKKELYQESQVQQELPSKSLWMFS